MVFLDGNYRLIEPQFHKVLMVNRRNMNIISEKSCQIEVLNLTHFKAKTLNRRGFKLKIKINLV